MNWLNLLEFAFFEKRVTHGPTDGRTKPLIELHFVTKNLGFVLNANTPNLRSDQRASKGVLGHEMQYLICLINNIARG